MRGGGAPLGVRRRAAEGALSLPVPETLEALVVLVADPEQQIREIAFHTLEHWDTQEMVQALSDPATPVAVLDFALESSLAAREELVEALLRNPALGGEAEGSSAKSERSAEQLGTERLAASAEAKESYSAPDSAALPITETETVLQRVAGMTASGKIRAALTGSAEERLILIRDSNKAVSRAVLASPRLGDQELETYASMKNVAEEVLRALASKRAFVRHYPVVRGLANNPRTPIDAVLPLLTRLNDRDLRALSVNRNVADAVRRAAARMFEARRGL